jgi:hypothetical protein
MNWHEQVEQFKKELHAEPSRMSSQAIRFAWFGFVGSGKSTTGALFALGITPEGKIGYVDGEGHRSGYAIDVACDLAAKHYGKPKADFVSRFTVVHIDPPFHPLRVVAAIEALEDQGCKTIIADIMTQCWDSDGGYLDLKADVLDQMAGNDEGKRMRSASAAAARVKPWTHGKLVNKVAQSKCNLVMLFQAKQKFNALTSKPDDIETPIQESGLTRTAFAVGRVESKSVSGEQVGGFCFFSGPGCKSTHPALRAMLPKDGEQLKIAHAEAVLKWCGGPAPAPPSATAKPKDELADLKRELWALLKDKHGGDKAKLQAWVTDELKIDVLLETMEAASLVEVLAAAKKKLGV